MRKLYSEPTMDVNVFDAENIVTESAGAPAGDGSTIDTNTYAKVTVGYTDLTLTF